MKGIQVKIVIAAFAMFGAINAAYAVTPYSNSVKYFDETGAVVGQQILFCDNHANHGGNIHTAYSISESMECFGNPPAHVIVPGTQIVSYTLPGFLTIGAACGFAQCVDSGIAPNRMTSVGWTWQAGWQ